ncbi:helix-turn-helix transcriptional regulator [Xanthobacter dioxanivorans]|uniref:Helix-turn-helix transcriptional regulator n=1 Tax=Xanthobacter dioxanivorans TaxID=2528964 RepID=A0A974SK12_9HYPH|nr:helix-turn-helix transcriptional regulator [Xanthobacter dioxanivorans]QRG07013.1 helix-turn-helix transcriptional regulator [Xanthobacter dioxanivorans]
MPTLHARQGQGTAQPPRLGPQRPDTLAGGSEVGAVCRLISVLGHANFMDELAQEYAALTGAAQVTTFFLEQQRVRCALAYRPREPRLVETLCRSYARGQFERDPVLQRHLEGGRQGGDFMARSFVSTDIYDEHYRSRFFSGADLSGKMALISRRGERVVYVNFYFRDAAPDAVPGLGPDTSGTLLAELLHKHDALTGGQFGAGTARTRAESYLKERFPGLSPREAQVCALIACGFSVAAIALELHVSEETVVTFRKRAYGKLSITSRGELFAQCAGLAM